MAEEDNLEDALGDAGEGDEGGSDEELDPLAEEMLKMMEEEGEEGGDLGSQEDVDKMMEMEMLRAMEVEGDGGGGGGGMSMGGGGEAIAGAPGGGGGGIPPNIQRLMDVELTVTILLGRARKTIEEVMDLGEQSLVELDKSVGEPVDVMVNGKLFARGEVVTVSENFGVRITELVVPISQL